MKRQPANRAFLPLLLPACNAAAAEAPASVTAGSLMQMVLGLAAVLAIVIACAWVLKRFSLHQGTGSGAVRVVAAAAVGQRERVVLVEIGDTWLVVGVGPGSVNALHSMQRAAVPAVEPASGVPARSFAQWLRQAKENRGAH